MKNHQKKLRMTSNRCLSGFKVFLGVLRVVRGVLGCCRVDFRAISIDFRPNRFPRMTLETTCLGVFWGDVTLLMQNPLKIDFGDLKSENRS